MHAGVAIRMPKSDDSIRNANMSLQDQFLVCNRVLPRVGVRRKSRAAGGPRRRCRRGAPGVRTARRKDGSATVDAREARETDLGRHGRAQIGNSEYK